MFLSALLVHGATDWANDGVFGDGWSLFGLAIPSIPSLIEGLLESLGTAAWLNGLILDGIVAGSWCRIRICTSNAGIILLFSDS